MPICDQPVPFDNFKLLASSNSVFHFKTKESRGYCETNVFKKNKNKNEVSLQLHFSD